MGDCLAMVLEFWFEQKSITPNTLEIIVHGIIFVSIAVAGVHLIGLQQATAAFLFLVGLPSIPFLLKVFQCEIELEEKKEKFLGSSTLARHYNALRVLAAFFLGLVIAFTFWYLFLPPETNSYFFGAQAQELRSVQGIFSDKSQGLAVASNVAFETIFMHNMQVLLFIVIFSLVYGAGAVFILIWNASVIGVFLGEFSKSYVLGQGAALTGAFGGQVTGIGLGFLGILPHGIFELLAYLTAALAGGILSAAIIRGDTKEKVFLYIVYDTAKLFAWAAIFLAIGAFLESYPALLG